MVRAEINQDYDFRTLKHPPLLQEQKNETEAPKKKETNEIEAIREQNVDSTELATKSSTNDELSIIKDSLRSTIATEALNEHWYPLRKRKAPQGIFIKALLRVRHDGDPAVREALNGRHVKNGKTQRKLRLKHFRRWTAGGGQKHQTVKSCYTRNLSQPGKAMKAEKWKYKARFDVCENDEEDLGETSFSPVVKFRYHKIGFKFDSTEWLA